MAIVATNQEITSSNSAKNFSNVKNNQNQPKEEFTLLYFKEHFVKLLDDFEEKNNNFSEKNDAESISNPVDTKNQNNESILTTQEPLPFWPLDNWSLSSNIFNPPLTQLISQSTPINKNESPQASELEQPDIVQSDNFQDQKDMSFTKNDPQALTHPDVQNITNITNKNIAITNKLPPKMTDIHSNINNLAPQPKKDGEMDHKKGQLENIAMIVNQGENHIDRQTDDIATSNEPKEKLAIQALNSDHRKNDDTENLLLQTFNQTIKKKLEPLQYSIKLSSQEQSLEPIEGLVYLEKSPLARAENLQDISPKIQADIIIKNRLPLIEINNTQKQSTDFTAKNIIHKTQINPPQDNMKALNNFNISPYFTESLNDIHNYGGEIDITTEGLLLFNFTQKQNIEPLTTTSLHPIITKENNNSLQQQMSISVKHAINLGKTEINISLYPESLGAVDVKIELIVNKFGALEVKKIAFTAEKHETLDLLKESRMELKKSLEQIHEIKKESTLDFGNKNHQNNPNDAHQNLNYFGRNQKNQNSVNNPNDITNNLTEVALSSTLINNGEYVTENNVNIRV